jgi:hypothetical protein
MSDHVLGLPSPTEFGLLDKIAIEIVNGKSGEFLRKFADAWLHADDFNKKILRSAFLRLIEEIDLEGSGR